MTQFEPVPDILEVTLRDGSYAIDFQFTAEDTATIAAALERVGFRWIEIGHGVGLGASRAGKGAAAASDEEYLRAAASSLKSAKWGTFFIPGIGTAEDLRLAAGYGMHFVRVGTNVTEADAAQPFIELAKELGMFVSYNAMKSYAVSAAEFGRKVALVRGWGADIACLVDSAGSMYPETVSAYLRAAKGESDAPLGFHGHDNLSLVMANTLRAIEEGAVIVDSSLQGMGRSAGNAITEVLVAILQGRKMLPGIDLKAAQDVGQGLIQPLLGRRGMDPMAVTGGMASFHSSFTPKVEKYARKYNIDVRDLIVRLCQEDQVSAPDELLERISHELAANKITRVISIPAFGVRSQNAGHGIEGVRALVRQIHPHAVKAGRFSALNVVTAEMPTADLEVSGNIQATWSHVMGSVTISSEDQLRKVLEEIDGHIDVALVDVDHKPFGPATAAELARATLKKTALLTYLDSRVWVDAVETQLVRLLDEVLEGMPVVIAGDHPKSRFLALRLAERAANVVVLSTGTPQASAEGIAPLSLSRPLSIRWTEAASPLAKESLAHAAAVVVWPGEEPWFGAEYAGSIKKGCYVLDARVGGIRAEGIAEAQRRGAFLVRVNIWPALTGALGAAHESMRNVRESLGWAQLAGVPVVAGGAMGRAGDVIIDSIRQPTRVIGIADGRGGVLFSYSSEDEQRVRRVSEEINLRLVHPRTEAVAGA